MGGWDITMLRVELEFLFKEKGLMNFFTGPIIPFSPPQARHAPRMRALT